MKTSFSLRVDKQRQVNESLDADFFGTHQRHERLLKFKAEITSLEALFIELRKKHPESKSITQMISVPEIKQVLLDLGDRKKKA